MKALILAGDGVEDMEMFYPYYRLKEEAAETTVATPGGVDITGKHGYPVKADCDCASIRSDEYDLLILPGGKGPESVRLDEDAVRVTREMVERGGVVAAVCHGAQVLISAEVLSGRTATCWPGVRDDLKAAGARYVDEEVVVDGSLITSRCPDDLPAFMREVLSAVSSAVG